MFEEQGGPTKSKTRFKALSHPAPVGSPYGPRVRPKSTPTHQLTHSMRDKKGQKTASLAQSCSLRGAAGEPTSDRQTESRLGLFLPRYCYWALIEQISQIILG